MKQTLAYCALLLFCVAATGSDTQIAKQITDLNAILQSSTERQDTATLSKLITDDYGVVDVNSKFYDRDAFLKLAGTPDVKWMANDPSDVSVKSYNGDCAILTGLLHVKFSYQGKIYDRLVRYTDVWVNTGGAWHYAAGQGTLVKRLE
ncbi:MAG TPA: nuclear transport factor 2 family protein [Candidatus Aquilonibacter sp.]